MPHFAFNQYFFGLTVASFLVLGCGGGEGDGAAGAGERGGTSGSNSGGKTSAGGQGGEHGGRAGAGGSSSANEAGAAGELGSGGSVHPAGGADAGGSDPGVPGCDCDDGIACTVDSCERGQCLHEPRHGECLFGEYCDANIGCRTGGACVKDEDCLRPDPCATPLCLSASRRCVYTLLDGDLDGESPIVCGGKDCNDADSRVAPGRLDTCNGKDDDCDGVVDPASSTGCGESRSCQAGACRCIAPERECPVGNSSFCTDLQTDYANCGACGSACTGSQTCVAGECVCPKGGPACGVPCVDLDSDPKHCGACNKSCGANACVAGTCTCQGSQVDCGSTSLDCSDLTQDPLHCGRCDSPCPGGAACNAGSCDVEVEFLRVFAGPSSAPKSEGIRLALDSMGASYVAMNLPASDYSELPSGKATLWGGSSASGSSGVAKFDEKGNFSWFVPCSGEVQSIATTSEAVWVQAWSELQRGATLEVAGKSFTLREDYPWISVVAKLALSDGKLLASYRVDGEELSTGMFASENGDVWLYGSSFNTVLLDETAYPLVEDYATFLHRIGSSSLTRIPGAQFVSAQGDTAGDIVVQLSLPELPFKMGENQFPGQRDALSSDLVVRFSRELQHKNSFLGSSDAVMAAYAKGVVMVGRALGSGLSTRPALDRYEYVDSGVKQVETTGIDEYPLEVVGASASGASLLTWTGSNTAFNLPLRAPVTGLGGALARFSLNGLQLEHLADFSVRPTDARVGPGGAVTLVAPFDGQAKVAGEVISGPPGTKGLALIRLRFR